MRTSCISLRACLVVKTPLQKSQEVTGKPLSSTVACTKANFQNPGRLCNRLLARAKSGQINSKISSGVTLRVGVIFGQLTWSSDSVLPISRVAAILSAPGRLSQGCCLSADQSTNRLYREAHMDRSVERRSWTACFTHSLNHPILFVYNTTCIVRVINFLYNFVYV